nr:general odorant binding protein 1 [Quadrastichus mendeli]
MKLLLVIFAATCVIGVYTNDNFPEKFNPQVEECLIEKKVDRQKYIDMITNPNFVRDREMDCLSACVMKKRNLMDANGKFTVDFETGGLGQICKAEYGKDECETASKLITCVLKKEENDKDNVNTEKSS